MSITDITADVIICPTDEKREPFGALENAIFDAAGREQLIKACKEAKEPYAICPESVSSIQESDEYIGKLKGWLPCGSQKPGILSSCPNTGENW